MAFISLEKFDLVQNNICKLGLYLQTCNAFEENRLVTHCKGGKECLKIKQKYPTDFIKNDDLSEYFLNNEINLKKDVLLFLIKLDKDLNEDVCVYESLVRHFRINLLDSVTTKCLKLEALSRLKNTDNIQFFSEQFSKVLLFNKYKKMDINFYKKASHPSLFS